MTRQLINLNEKLIPVIIQEDKSKDVLMLGYMNREALQITKKSGYIWFWSRSKKRLWMKGEVSGNKLKLVQMQFDCDKDALLVYVRLIGESVCHTGSKSCFIHALYKN